MERHLPDSTTLFHRSCACNGTNSTDLPLTFTSSGREVEVHFTSANMTTEDDPEHIYFEATFEFIKVPYVCMEGRRKSGPSGTNSISMEDVSFSFVDKNRLVNDYCIICFRSNAVPVHGLLNRHIHGIFTFV